MRIVMVGFGVVGQSFAKILQAKSKELLSDFGFRPRVVAIVDRGGAAMATEGLDLRRMLSAKSEGRSVGSDSESGSANLNALEIIEDVEADLVIETTPTSVTDGQPGLSHIEKALKSGRHVITTNKGPLARAMPGLLELASYNRVCLRFSGTVGGGTPILDLAKKCTSGNRIRSIRGILNGTTNYILTRMASEKMDMETALGEAQRLGYAEADPSYDIGGVDAACKVVIIANWVMGMNVSIRDVEVAGISKIALGDVEDAQKQGYGLRLIGSIGEGLSVKPQRIPLSHPLCVAGTLNAVTLDTELAGEITLTGKGAGGMETASAVLRDLIDVRRTLL